MNSFKMNYSLRFFATLVIIEQYSVNAWYFYQMLIGPSVGRSVVGRSRIPYRFYQRSHIYYSLWVVDHIIGFNGTGP